MMYALSLDENNRILSVTYDQYAPQEQPRVDELPEGNVSDYLYVGGEYFYDPILVPPAPEPEPTADDILNALLGVKE